MTYWEIVEERPNVYSVREIAIIGGIGAVLMGENPAWGLEDARRWVPPGSQRLPRDPEDASRLIEAWRRF